jgi:hypothetical protein
MNVDSIADVGMINEELAPPPGRSVWPSVTVEHALLGLTLLVAAFLRFFALAAQPLNPLEASNVWPAWLAATATVAPDPPTPTSPLFHSLQTALFWLAGGGDGLARFLPAVAGVGLVGLAWLFRPWIGRSAALIMALLIAIDPWLMHLSRLADGAALSLFFGVLTLAALLHLLDEQTSEADDRRWRRTIAISAGLLVVSGPLGWSFVVVCALLLIVVGPAGARLRNRGVGGREDGILFLVAALLGATAWLAQPTNLGLISTSLSAWTSQWAGESLYPLRWWLLRLIVDQPLLLIFGIIGLVRLWLQPLPVAEIDDVPAATGLSVWRLFLTAWLIWGVLLGFLPGRNPLSLPMVGLPLLLATADLTAYLIARLYSGILWREAWLLVALVTVLLISAIFWGTALVAATVFDLSIFRGLVLFVLLIFLTVVLYGLWADWMQARILIGAYGGILLLLATLSSGWQLNQRLERDEPDGFFVQTTDPELRRLASDIQTLSAQRTGDATQIPLLVQIGSAEGGRPVPQAAQSAVGGCPRGRDAARWTGSVGGHPGRERR